MQYTKRKKTLFTVMLVILLTRFLPSAYAGNTEAIADAYTDMMQYVISLSAPSVKKDNPAHFQQKFKAKFLSLLKERFSADELLKIHTAIQKVGGKNIVKISQVILETLTTKIHPKIKLEDFQLTLSPAYDEALEKLCSQKKVKERLKGLYIKYCAQKKIPLNEGDADKFALIALKHLKKTIADHFTEDQFCTWSSFDDSALGKRVNDILGETIALSITQ